MPTQKARQTARRQRGAGNRLRHGAAVRRARRAATPRRRLDRRSASPAVACYAFRSPLRDRSARCQTELAEAEAERALVETEDAGGPALVAVGERQRLHEDLALEVAQGGAARGNGDRRSVVRAATGTPSDGEIGRDDEAAAAENGRPLHRVPELADVPLPAVGLEHDAGLA